MPADPPPGPRYFGAAEVEAALGWGALVAALREAFRDPGQEAPPRHHHTLPLTPGPDGTLLLMPALQRGGDFGVKLVTVYPRNAARSLPAIAGLYVLFEGDTGTPVAVMEGGALTARRTAAASALAADHLARRDARTLLVVGTGRLAPLLAEAHRAVRPSIARILVWGRDPAKARAVAERVERHTGAACAAAGRDLDRVAGEADIVTCATLSAAPLVHGDALRPGCHVDLVGAYLPDMRESDDALFRRAGKVFVDTRAGAMAEAGDVIQAIRAGAFRAEDISGELADLCAGRHAGRQDDAEITVFKSVGAAIEDLAAARLVWRGCSGADGAGG